MMPADLVTPGVVSNLTDGTGVSRLFASKVVKDLVLDALLSVPVSLVAIGIGGLDAAVAAPVAVAFAVGDSLIRVLYRAALRWAQTPS
jgi:ABC-type antimicrobial peptide transport system permease subunit